MKPSRSYKQSDNWRQTKDLGFDDLLTMAELLDQAHTWIAAAMLSGSKARNSREKAA